MFNISEYLNSQEFKDLLKDNNKKYEISYLEKALNEIKITDGKTS